MASLGRWVTAAGGLMVAIFSLVGWIVALTERAENATLANAAFQGILIMLLGAAIVAGALTLYDRYARLICGVAVAATLAATATSAFAMLGGMSVYVVLGGVAAIMGANWQACCPAEQPTQPQPAEQPPSQP